MTEQALRPIGGVVPKLQDHHLRRQAIVYVRQSHPQQVLDHVESTARQYGLVDRAVAWGWVRDRLMVIDEDQGQSGQSMVTRLGFQRLLAEVSLDHVGLILGLEMSCLARSNRRSRRISWRSPPCCSGSRTGSGSSRCGGTPARVANRPCVRLASPSWHSRWCC